MEPDEKIEERQPRTAGVRNLLQTAPYSKAYRALLMDRSVGASELRTYLMLVQRIGERQYTTVSQEQLADDLGLTARVVRRHIAALKERGLLETEPRSGGTDKVWAADPVDIYGLDLFRPFNQADATPDENVLPPRTKTSYTPDENVLLREKKKKGEEEKGEEETRLRRGPGREVASWGSETPPSGKNGTHANRLHESVLVSSEESSDEDSPTRTPTGKSRRNQEAPLKPQGLPGGGLGLVLGALKAEYQTRWPEVPFPRSWSGKDIGQTKTLLKRYSSRETVQMIRLMVWDWEAVQAKCDWPFSKHEYPTIDTLQLGADKLAPMIKSGCTSKQHRFSKYASKFLAPKTPSKAENGDWGFLDR